MRNPLDQQRRTRVGQRSERVIEDMHEALELAGVAHVRKVTTPTSGAPGKGMRFTKRSGVDFVGVILCGPRAGRAVYVEAKHVDRPRFDLARIEPHQWNELAIAHRAGAASLVLVIGPTVETWALPFEVLQSARALGHASIPREQLEIFRVRGSHYLTRWTR